MVYNFYRIFITGVFSFIVFSSAYANDNLHLPGDLTLSDSAILNSGGIIATQAIEDIGDLTVYGKIIGAIKYEIGVTECNTGNTCDLATTLEQGFCYLSAALNPGGKGTHNYRVYFDSNHNWKIEVSGGQNVQGVATCIKWSVPNATTKHELLKAKTLKPSVK